MSDVDVIITTEEAEDILTGFAAPDEVFTSEEQRIEVADYLIDEIEKASGERKEREETWARWRRQRLAKPKSETVSYPWPGASNSVPPESMSVTNISFSQLKGKYMNLDPLWKVNVSREELEKKAKALEELINYCGVNQDQMNLRKHNNTIMYDCVSLGTQLGKILWDVNKVKYRRAGEERVVVTHDGPNFIPIRLEDFYTRSFMTETDSAPWYAVRTLYYKHELEKAVQNGFFNDSMIEQVLQNPVNVLDDNKAEEKSMGGDSPDFSGEGQYEVYECSLFWDVDEDGVSEDIKIWVEPTSRLVLREEYNELGFRDIQKFPFQTVPYEFYANGIGAMTDQMQEELTSLHNMAINSGHLNSLQMFVARPGSSLADIDAKPMQVIEAESPKEDIQLLTFPDMTASARILEETARQYIIRATGVNYAMAGLPDMVMKSRFSPSGYDQQATQGASFLELMTKNFDEAYGELGKKLFYLLLAYKDRTRETLFPKFSLETQGLLEEIFTMSDADIQEAFNFSVRITPMDETDEAEQQKTLMLTQLYATYIQQIMPVMQQLSNPQIQQMPQMQDILMRVAVGLSEMMEDQIESMSDLDAQNMLPYLEQFKLALRAMDIQKDAQLAPMKEQVNEMERSGASGMGEQSAQGSAEGAGGMGQAGGEQTPSGPQTGQLGAGTSSSGGIEVLG